MRAEAESDPRQVAAKFNTQGNRIVEEVVVERLRVGVSTSVLKLLSPVVGAVFALHAEVDVGADAAVVERLHRANVVAHAQEDLRRLVLAQQPQGVHLG